MFFNRPKWEDWDLKQRFLKKNSNHLVGYVGYHSPILKSLILKHNAQGLIVDWDSAPNGLKTLNQGLANGKIDHIFGQPPALVMRKNSQPVDKKGVRNILVGFKGNGTRRNLFKKNDVNVLAKDVV
jgi:hypothetical protein